jgi:hypothetical protein
MLLILLADAAAEDDDDDDDVTAGGDVATAVAGSCSRLVGTRTHYSK